MPTAEFPTGIGRETIASAFFGQLLALLPNYQQAGNLYIAAEGQLTQAQPIALASRRYWLPGQGPNQYPRLMMLEKGEMYDRSGYNLPAIVTLIYHVIIQTADGGDQGILTATLLNDVADSVEGIVENYPSFVGSNQLNMPNGQPLVAQSRMDGREVIYISSQSARFSEMDIEVSVLVPYGTIGT